MNMNVISDNSLKTILTKIRDYFTITTTFTDTWFPAFRITGFGSVLQVPKTSKNQKLTITKVRVFAKDIGWMDATLDSVNDVGTQWIVNIAVDTTKITTDGPMIAAITGTISKK